MAENDLKWLEIAGMARNDWKLKKMGGNGPNDNDDGEESNWMALTQF